MKDIHTPVRQLFYNVIETTLGYKLYENGAIPDTAVTPYIIISDVTSSEDSNKTGFGNSVQILLDIVTSYGKNQVGGSKPVDIIAGDILAAINSKVRFAITGDLQIVNTKVLQDQKINAKSDTNRIFRRLIRFQQLIMEV